MMKKKYVAAIVLTFVLIGFAHSQHANAQRPQAPNPQLSLAEQEANRLQREKTAYEQERNQLVNSMNALERRAEELNSESNSIERARPSVTDRNIDSFNHRVRAYNVAAQQIKQSAKNLTYRAEESDSRRNRLNADIASFKQRYSSPRPNFDSMPKTSGGGGRLTINENNRR